MAVAVGRGCAGGAEGRTRKGRCEVSDNHNRPTPETDAFMLRIDDSEIDLDMVEAALMDMERERDEARAMVKRIHRCLVTGGYGSNEYAEIMEAIEAGKGERCDTDML